MKKQNGFGLIVALFLMSGCGGVSSSSGQTDGSSSPVTEENTGDICFYEDAQDPNQTDGMKIEYAGDWGYNGDYRYAGLYDTDGSPHELPKEHETTGATINVLYYGAIADDDTVDNTKAVKAAISASSAGDEIYFPAGRYYFSTQAIATPVFSHILLPEGVNLRGEGSDRTFLVSKFSSYNNLTYQTSVISVISSSDITISDLSVTAEVPEEYMPVSLSTQQNNPDGNAYAPKYGIYVQNTDPTELCSNIVIRNLNIEYFQVAGVQLTSTIDCTVQDTTISNATDIGGGGAGYAICIRGLGWERFEGIGTNLDSRFNRVSNVTMTGPYLRHGVILSYVTHNNLITDCVADNTQIEPFDMHGEDEFLNVYSCNTAKNIPSYGIGLGNSGSTHDASGPANVLYKNEILSCDGGISITYGTPSTVAVANTVRDVSADAVGIYVSYGPGTVLKENLLENETLTDGTTGIRISYSYVWNDPAAGISTVYVSDNQIVKYETGMELETYGAASSLSGNQFTGCTNGLVDASAAFVLPEKSTYFDAVEGGYLYPTQEANINRGSYNDVISNTGYFYFKGSEIEREFNRMIFYEFDLPDAFDAAQSVYLRLTFTSKSAKQHFFLWGKEDLEWDSDSLTWGNAPYVNNVSNNPELSEDPTCQYSTSEYPYAAQVYDPNGELTFIGDFEAVAVSEEYLTYYVDISEYFLAAHPGNFTMILSNETMDAAYSSVRNMKGNSESVWPCLIYA